MSTFFTVCIPSTNRGKTIYNTLASLSKQVFKNFDVRIVDCKSGDNTVEEINRFFESSLFLNDPFKYEFVVKDYIPQT
ncbi:MAG: glycosyltransferase, partial [Filimonas sp.]|nr:glycosyltransferase [Filimonas sp.]